MIEVEEIYYENDKDFWYSRNERVFSIQLDFHDKIALSQYLQVLNDKKNIHPRFVMQNDGFYNFIMSSQDGLLKFNKIKKDYISDLISKLKNCKRYYVIATYSESNLSTKYLEHLIISFKCIKINNKIYKCGQEYNVLQPN